MMRGLLCTAWLLCALLPTAGRAQSDTELRALAAQFPAMPRDSAGMGLLLGRAPTFSSGGPFNDLEFTAIDTDYIDGENGGFDVFLPVDPSDAQPGSNSIKLVSTALNTDLNDRYGVGQGDRIILGDAMRPFFLRGGDGVDNDYAVVQHLDFRFGFIELSGAASDYRLVYCTTAQGCRSEGWYLFHARGAPDLIAFIFPCDSLASSVSGNPPQNLNALCNADKQLSLANNTQFQFARAASSTSVIDGIGQFGGNGKDLLGAVTSDAAGNVYLVGGTDSNLDGGVDTSHEIYVLSVSDSGRQRWVTELPLPEGSMLKGASTDGQFVYACGRTLGALPGFTSAGRWDGILLKLDATSGAIVAMHQWGNPGIDGYGNCILDDSGHLFLAGQGSPPGPATTDDLYLVSKHRASDLSPVWVALDRPDIGGFVASSEAWGKLAYRPGAAPGQGRLAVSGWYMGPSGAEAFLEIYENLHLAAPTRRHSLVLGSQQGRAEWILGAAFDPQGRLFVAGYTSGNIGGAAIGEGDLFAIRLEPDLSNPLRVQFGTPQSEWTRSVGFDSAGRFVVVGNTFGDLGGANADQTRRSADVFVRSFDQNLNPVATRQFGSSREDRAMGLVRGDDIVIAGTTEGSLVASNRGSMDLYAVRVRAGDLSLAPNPIDATGAWFNPAQDGHGLLLEHLPNNTVLASWFTYDPAGSGTQRWFAGTGPIAGGVAEIEVFDVTGSGARFIPNWQTSATMQRPLGRLRIEFASCSSARIDYTLIAPYGSGNYSMQRLSAPNGSACGGAAIASGAIHGMTGAWYDPAQSGHGLLVQNLADNTVIATWYTYDSSGQPAWILGSGRIENGIAVLRAERTSGGRFVDGFNPANVQRVVIGELRLTMTSCNQGRIDYSLGGAFGTGSMALTRLTQPKSLGCR